MSQVLVATFAILIAVLIYFAGVQRRKRYRAEDVARHEAEREEARQKELLVQRRERINAVVTSYRDLRLRSESSNLPGMLKAGVRSLHDTHEVAEACRLIEESGLPPPIPVAYQDELAGADLLSFFQDLNKHGDQARSSAGVRELARQVKRAGGA